MIIDTTQDRYSLMESLKFRLLLSLIGKGALIQHKGKLYQPTIITNWANTCQQCCFDSMGLCSTRHLWDFCTNIEDALEKIEGNKATVVFKKYEGKLPPDELIVVL